MGNRFDILYRFSTDNGATWTDLTPQVDSLQTSITQNLCLNTFLSAKDEATIVLPETPLYNPDGTATPKKQLIDAIFGNDPILVHINETKPGVKVLWDDNDVLWNGNHVMWSFSMRRFTGYVDRSSISLRSYPLPPNLTVRLQDVSVLHLDDKVDMNVCLEDDPDGTRLRISTIVSALLGYAGYTNIGSLALEAGDDQIIEAFVIDKDKAKTYRNYIDTLLFEAGGYVLDFNEYGQANVVHLRWDGSVAADRILDNPMNNDGVTMRTAYLVNDGASVKWSTLAWAENERIWQSNISQKIEDGVMVGDIVHDQGYWPNNGDVSPVYFQYDARLLDIPYLHKDTRWENEDLSIIMAKNTHFGVDTLKGTTPVPISDWSKHDPNTWPTGDTWHDKYGLNSNPQHWPTKMWIQLQNTSGEDYNVSLAYIYGDVLYRNRINTIKTADSKNPKEYVSEYIYDKDHAERFLQFYWHFLQTSRYQFNWSEPNVFDALNSVISVGIKGNGTTQKALVVGKTSKWLNAATEIVSFASVAIDAYVPEALIPTVIAPSSSQTPIPSAKNAITATFSTTPSFTLAEWETFSTSYQSWTVLNVADFTVGSVAMIQGVISDMDNLPVTLYMDVTAVDLGNNIISGTGIRIRYIPVASDWDFDMSQYSAIRNDRLPNSYTDITLTAKIPGHEDVTPYWTVTGNHSHFTPGSSQTATGTTVTLRVWGDESLASLDITMADPNDPLLTVTKKLTISNATVYDYNFGEISALPLPTHIDPPDNTLIILEGDYFVAGANFSSFTKGIPYMYDGVSSWNAMTATTENAYRMLGALATVLTNPSIQPSTGALYGWFENLTVIRAIIENLTTINLSVGPGTGQAGSGFRFRALDNNGSPIFDVMYGNVTLFKVDIATGKIYFGQGFWYDPDDSAIHSLNDNVIINSGGSIIAKNATIKEGSRFEGSFDCDVIKTEPVPASHTDYPSRTNSGTQARLLWEDLYSAGLVPASGSSGYFPIDTVGVTTPFKYIRVAHTISGAIELYAIYFADANLSEYAIGQYYDLTNYNSGMIPGASGAGMYTGYLGGNLASYRYATNGITIRVYTGGNRLWVNIPQGASGLSSGDLYYELDSGGGSGTLHVKL